MSLEGDDDMKELYIIILLILAPMNNAYAAISQAEFMSFIFSDKDPHVSDSEYKALYKTFFSNIKPSDNPEIIIIAGGPGSGKTTFRKKSLKMLKNFHLHDMDEVIIRLEGYKNDVKKYGKLKAFSKWWPVAYKTVNQLVQYAFAHNFNVIYDRTCCTEKSLNDLHDAVLNKKYKAKMYAFYVLEKVALDRAKQRARKENRAVPPETVRECGKRFNAMFEDYLKFLPEITLYCHGKICLKKENQVIKEIDSNAYNEFLNYGEKL